MAGKIRTSKQRKVKNQRPKAIKKFCMFCMGNEAGASKDVTFCLDFNCLLWEW